MGRRKEAKRKGERRRVRNKWFTEEAVKEQWRERD
jgi:hypothetical protein